MGKEPGIYKKFVRKLYIVSENCWKIVRKIEYCRGECITIFFENKKFVRKLSVNSGNV